MSDLEEFAVIINEINKISIIDLLKKVSFETATIMPLIEGSKQYIFRNASITFWNQLHADIKMGITERIAVMGLTRCGKSMSAIRIAGTLTMFTNSCFDKGIWDNVASDIEKRKVTFGIEHIHASPSEYLYHQEDGFKAKKLVFGQCHVIDELPRSTGGLGSTSEILEIENYEDIAAKYKQHEVWVTPREIINVNTNFGINMLIKDIQTKINWGLLYRMTNRSKGIDPTAFIGWVGFPLPTDQELLLAYEEQKNKRINDLISGKGDKRSQIRFEAIKIMLPDKRLYEMNKKGEIRIISREKIVYLIDRYISEGKIRKFNETEKYAMADGVQMEGKLYIQENLETREEQ